jgi:HSP20 family molecular chaperone IbpA
MSEVMIMLKPVLKNSRTLLIAGVAALSLLGTGALAVYNWALQGEVNTLRAESDPGRDILRKLEQQAEQRAQAEWQMSVLDPWAGMGFGIDPFQRLQQMQQQIDQFFNGMPGSSMNFGGNGSGGFSAFSGAIPQPEIAVQESDEEYRIIIAVADGSEVELSTALEDNTLSISAQVRSERTNSNGGLRSSSTHVSQFSRAIMLDEPVDATGMRTNKTAKAIVITIPKIG